MTAKNQSVENLIRYNVLPNVAQ